MTCLFEAMRDRKPGLYRVVLDHTWTNGADVSSFTLFPWPEDSNSEHGQELPWFASCEARAPACE